MSLLKQNVKVLSLLRKSFTTSSKCLFPIDNKSLIFDLHTKYLQKERAAKR